MRKAHYLLKVNGRNFQKKLNYKFKNNSISRPSGLPDVKKNVKNV